MRAIAAACAAAIAVGIPTGCALDPPRVNTTFLRAVDLVEMTDRMAASLANDPLVRARGPESEPWVISLDRVVNRTNEVIPEREKWLYLARLRARLAETATSRERGLVWVIPPERWRAIAPVAGPDLPPPPRRTPTHLLTAEFHALTNTWTTGRTDAYLNDYQLIDLRSGEIVWEDAWEVKRAIEGLTFD